MSSAKGWSFMMPRPREPKMAAACSAIYWPRGEARGWGQTTHTTSLAYLVGVIIKKHGCGIANGVKFVFTVMTGCLHCSQVHFVPAIFADRLRAAPRQLLCKRHDFVPRHLDRDWEQSPGRGPRRQARATPIIPPASKPVRTTQGRCLVPVGTRGMLAARCVGGFQPLGT